MHKATFLLGTLATIGFALAVSMLRGSSATAPAIVPPQIQAAGDGGDVEVEVEAVLAPLPVRRVTVAEDVEPARESVVAEPRVSEVELWLRRVLPDALGNLSSAEIAALTELDLCGAEITDDDLRLLGELRELRLINLRGTAITDAGLAHLRNLGELESIVLRGTAITGDGLRDLPVASLEALHLCDSELSGSDLRELPSMPHLEVLKLNFLDLSDEDFALVQAYPSLRHLELDETQISDAGLERLLLLHPRIQRVELRNTAVTDAGVERLRALYPDCEFVSDSGLSSLLGY